MYNRVLLGVWDTLENGLCGGPKKEPEQLRLWGRYRRIRSIAITPTEMDKLYPPKKIDEKIDRMRISDECKQALRLLVAEVNPTYGEYRAPDRDGPAQCKDYHGLMKVANRIAIGLFVPKIAEDKKAVKKSGLQATIYLCPERIRAAALDCDVPEEDMITAVWVHEFGHSTEISGVGFDLSEHFAQSTAARAFIETNSEGPLAAMVELSEGQPGPYQWFQNGPPCKAACDAVKGMRATVKSTSRLLTREELEKHRPLI